jgi:hypothetical protein
MRVEGPVLARVVDSGDGEEVGWLAGQNDADETGEWGVYIVMVLDENRVRIGPVPVMQPFAGPAEAENGAVYGGQLLPPVGAEVAVDFIAGDPERPVVIGCVEYPESTIPYQGGGAVAVVNLFMKALPVMFWINQIKTVGQFAEGFLSRRSLWLTGKSDRHLTIVDSDGDFCRYVGGDHLQTVWGCQRICVVQHLYELEIGNRKLWHHSTAFAFYVQEKKLAMLGPVTTRTEGLTLSVVLDGAAHLVSADHSRVELGASIFIAQDTIYERTEEKRMEIITLDILKGETFDRECEKGMDLAVMKQYDCDEEYSEEFKTDNDLVLKEEETTKKKTEEGTVMVRLMQTETISGDSIKDMFVLSIHV